MQSVEAYCWLEAISPHPERGKHLELGALPNGRADMGTQIPRALTQSADAEQAGANVPRQSIDRGARGAADEQAPVRGRQIHEGPDAWDGARRHA
jgi:hypothetical protein